MTSNQKSPRGGSSTRPVSFTPAAAACAVLLLFGFSAGCGSPSKANVQLRRERDQLRGQVESLKSEIEADRNRLRSLEAQTGTLPTLPQERLDHLYTAHGIELGRLTGGYDAAPDAPGDEALKVYLTPTDDAGDPVKATGDVVVEVFNLDQPGANRVGRWEFSPEDVKKTWRGFGPLQAFVLVCPWQMAPQQKELTVRVTYRDALTGRTFDKLQQVTVKLPPTTRPANPS